MKSKSKGDASDGGLFGFFQLHSETYYKGRIILSGKQNKILVTPLRCGEMENSRISGGFLLYWMPVVPVKRKQKHSH